MDKSNQNLGTSDNGEGPSTTTPKTSLVVRSSMSSGHKWKEQIIRPFLGFLNAKLIFIMGAARSGKSSLFESITGETGHSGPGIDSVTRDYEMELRTINDQTYLLVDTPGFRAHDIPSETVLENIANLVRLVDGQVEYAGILQVCPAGTPWLTDFINEVEALREFCGNKFLTSVTFVTTKWDYYRDEQLQEQIADVSELEQRWAEMMPGSRVYHHGLVNGATLSLRNNRDERGRLAREMVSTNHGIARGIVPKFVQELEDGIEVTDTNAARMFRGHGIQERQNPQQQQSSQRKERPKTRPETGPKTRPKDGFDWTGALWRIICSGGYFVRLGASKVLNFIKRLANILPEGTDFRPRFRKNGFEICITLPDGAQAVVSFANGRPVFSYSYTRESSGTGMFDQDEESGSNFDGEDLEGVWDEVSDREDDEDDEDDEDEQDEQDDEEKEEDDEEKEEDESWGCSVM